MSPPQHTTDLPSRLMQSYGHHPVPIVGIVGWKNSGKTTLVIRLVEEFSRRGLRVATIKHAHHNLRFDDGETDSARHRHAGAQQVAVVSSRRWAIITEHDEGEELGFADILTKLNPCGLIIVEGYKAQPIAKIEVRSAKAARQDSLAANDPDIIAIVQDTMSSHATLPNFQHDDITAIADFITERLL